MKNSDYPGRLAAPLVLSLVGPLISGCLGAKQSGASHAVQIHLDTGTDAKRSSKKFVHRESGTRPDGRGEIVKETKRTYGANRRMMFACILALLFFGSGPLFAQTPYGDEHFDGTFTAPIWHTDNFGPLQWVSDGVVNGAVRLEACASPSSSGHCTTSTSSYGQETAVSTNKNTHSGYVCGSGTNPKSDCTAVGDGVGQQEETWYRFHIRLAPGFAATPGTQNALFEFHVDQRTEADAKANGGVTAYSTIIDIKADGPSCSGSPAWCGTPGTNPRLFLQVPGGPTSCGTACQKRIYPFPSNSLLINHWYDMVLHMVWSPTQGSVQWWVDGQKMVDVATPTEYVRSDGTWSYATGLGLYNYRHWASWPSSVDGDEFIWGPSAASIGFGTPTSTGSQPLPPTAVTSGGSVASQLSTWSTPSSAGVTSYNVYRSSAFRWPLQQSRLFSDY